jgi:hypothetical protein
MKRTKKVCDFRRGGRFCGRIERDLDVVPIERMPKCDFIGNVKNCPYSPKKVELVKE